jgi:hypothetical protein
MKKFVAVLFLLLCSTSLIYGQKSRLGQATEKPNPAEYPIKVHISATHIRHYCTSFRDMVYCVDGLYADAIVNGKKIELSGSAKNILKHQSVLIIPGDYQIKLTKDNNSADGTLFGQEYDLLLPNGTIWHCVTSGISE